MNKYYILHNHHLGNQTVVFGEVCINGCQVFHKDEAMDVFERFSVSNKHRHDVMELFSKYNPTVGFDLHDLFHEVVFCDGDVNVYNLIDKIVEYYMTDDLRDGLFNSSNPMAVISGMDLYNNTQLRKLVDHENHEVRAAVVACCGKDLLDILINDESSWVQLGVLTRGYEEHLNKLIHCDSNLIRVAVAKYGNKQHLDFLVNDSGWDVRMAVAERGFKEHTEVLINDTNYHVRQAAQNAINGLQYMSHKSNNM